MNVLITGGTGFIGKKLGSVLSQKNHKIFILTRSKKKSLPYACTQLSWDELEELVESKSVEIDAVINLAGESIAQRWTRSAKQKILESRIKTTSMLVRIFKTSNLKVFISASAIGYYGDRNDELLDEDSGAGSGFLTDVCRKWEEEAFKIRNGTKVVVFRLGLVLGKNGGALPKMIFAFKNGLGGRIGDGRAWMSWIHIDDLTEMIATALSGDFQGIYNAVSPNPITNQEFSSALASQFNKKLFLPIPKLALKISLGEMSEAVVSSQRVSAKHALSQGFKYKHSVLKEALADILGNDT
jgi:uncharacterized protein (TIGR01777 family)